MFCNRCGHSLPDASLFCSRCGEQLGATAGLSTATSKAAQPETKSSHQPFNKGPRVSHVPHSGAIPRKLLACGLLSCLALVVFHGISSLLAIALLFVSFFFKELTVPVRWKLGAMAVLIVGILAAQAYDEHQAVKLKAEEERHRAAAEEKGASQSTSLTSSAAPATSTAETPAQKRATDQRFEACRTKLKKAQKLDLLYDLSMDGGRPHVVVGPTFYTIPLDAKQGFADTVNCFLMTGEDKYINFDILDYQTGKVVAEYRYGTVTVK